MEALHDVLHAYNGAVAVSVLNEGRRIRRGPALGDNRAMNRKG